MDAVRNLGRDLPQLSRRDAQRHRREKLFRGFVSGVGLGIAGLIVLLILVIVWNGARMINWEFLSREPLENMTQGGIRPMILGSFYLIAGTLALVLPLGVFGGIYLAEYAGTKKWVDLVRSLITSLAGTPSIVFALFGLAIFVLQLKIWTRGYIEGTSLISGWLTLATMALPIVVLVTESAVKAVPMHQIDGAYALGMTRWQTMWKVVLPQAAPNIMTGLVLATARTAGEAPPILFTAGVFYATVQPQGWEILRGPVQSLPYHITEAVRQPSLFAPNLVWGACLVLMGIIFIVNLTALIVRARAQRIT